MINSHEVVIVDAVRSATAKPNSRLSRFHVTDLLGNVLQSLFERNNVDPNIVDHVAGGCIAQVGEQANNVTRTAWLLLGFHCMSGPRRHLRSVALVNTQIRGLILLSGLEWLT